MLDIHDKLQARENELDKIVAECEIKYETMYYNAKFKGSKPYYEFNGEEWEQDNADVLAPILLCKEEASVKYDVTNGYISLGEQDIIKHCNEREAELEKEIIELNSVHQTPENNKEVQERKWQIEEIKYIRRLIA